MRRRTKEIPAHEFSPRTKALTGLGRLQRSVCALNVVLSSCSGPHSEGDSAMWFLSKRNAPLTRSDVPKGEMRPSRLTATPMKKSGKPRPLAVEVLEDRLAPATLLQTLYPPDA